MKRAGAVANMASAPRRKGRTKAVTLPESLPPGTSPHHPACPSATSEPQPPFDECLPGLFFEALTTLQAAAMSAIEQVPYSALRKAAALTDKQKQELASATAAVLSKHHAFIAQHKTALECGGIITALFAAKVDALLTMIDSCEPLPAAGQCAHAAHVCSRRELLGIALVVLAPLSILGVFLLIEHLRSR